MYTVENSKINKINETDIDGQLISLKSWLYYFHIILQIHPYTCKQFLNETHRIVISSSLHTSLTFLNVFFGEP